MIKSSVAATYILCYLQRMMRLSPKRRKKKKIHVLVDRRVTGKVIH